jgi:hypothetical protein
MLFINRLAKVADDPIVQGPDPVDIIGVGSHEDCRNRAPCIDEASVEFESVHRRHVYVGDQAGRLGETGGCKEIVRRCKSLGGIGQ